MEHFEAIKSLNIYSDGQDIDRAFQVLDKQDFCIPKKTSSSAIAEFNPYTLDPQNIGHNQCFTSTVMHAISLQVFRQGILQRLAQDNKVVRMLDYGCGFGYSTLAFSLLADSLMKSEHTNKETIFQVIGVDVYSDFVEKSIVNHHKYKKHIDGRISVDFQVSDYLDTEGKLRGIESGSVDLVNFGFETSLDTLKQKEHLLKQDALILAPISAQQEGSLEQTYSLLQYTGKGQFSTLSEIMRTSFSMRVDKQRQVNESLDADYFATHMIHEKLVKLKAEIGALESKFIELRKRHGGIIALNEIMRVPEIKQVLIELGDRKKKAQKLEFAIRDTAAQAKQEVEQE